MLFRSFGIMSVLSMVEGEGTMFKEMAKEKNFLEITLRSTEGHEFELIKKITLVYKKSYSDLSEISFIDRFINLEKNSSRKFLKTTKKAGTKPQGILLKQPLMH